MPFVKRLRVLSLVEGLSTLILFFVAMPLKYVAGQPMAVRLAGSVHGLLFVGLVLTLGVAVRRVPLPRSLALTGVLAAIVPFGPFWFDRRLREALPGLEDEDPPRAS